ncbi:hypothetical protein CASFOL_002827 [Castilleja foliolosa]|uniref:DUF4378 domain-containing protein n=1 Tax=Castilleja foliolosa TaxID=1961234 RepID=A0ABD3EG39_9LAMI
MGKHFWMCLDESNNKQPGCMWGLAHVLDYHHWHSNVQKMITHRKYDDRTLDKLSTGDWNPESKLYSPDANETEKLLVHKESPFVCNKKSRVTKKRSLKALVKALSGEEKSRESKDKRRKPLKPSLQRTYSIHHLESLDDDDDDDVSKIPRADSKKGPDVLEILKIDKGLLVKRLQESRFSKSTSFRKKLKPVKLENKQKEIWSFPIENKIETVNNSPHSERCVLNESMDKYAQLFENSFRMGIGKLSVSKSLKLTNDYRHDPVCFRRIRSLSNVDSCYFNQDFEVLVDGVRNSNCKENMALDANMQVHEKDAGLRLLASEEEEEDGFVSGLESYSLEHQVSEGLGDASTFPETNLSLDTDYAVNLENNEISDLHYARHLLDRSGIAVDPYGITWHASDQPLGPQLFEELEACWPHEPDLLNAWPDFCGCWHHQMVFDLVNEVLVELYDLSLPYYPKALSSSCHVRPFPGGAHIVDNVCTTIGALLSMELDEKQSLDAIVGRDLARDQFWMNLQLEMESVALYFEDVIFNELLEEVIFS